MKLLSSALYHGLTTGLGRATLGEEYCGIDQVAAGEWGGAGLVGVAGWRVDWLAAGLELGYGGGDGAMALTMALTVALVLVVGRAGGRRCPLACTMTDS